MTGKRKPQQWAPGQSGNPAGRPKGAGKIGEWRAALAEHVPDIMKKLVEQAKAGDPVAARLILERALPAVKPVEQPVSLDLPEGSLTDQGRALLASVASGVLSPGQGAQLMTALGSLSKIAEIDELAARIAALEKQHERTA